MMLRSSKAYILNNTMANSIQNCQFSIYDVIRFNERFVTQSWRLSFKWEKWNRWMSKSWIEWLGGNAELMRIMAIHENQYIYIYIYIIFFFEGLHFQENKKNKFNKLSWIARRKRTLKLFTHLLTDVSSVSFHYPPVGVVSAENH